MAFTHGFARFTPDFRRDSRWPTPHRFPGRDPTQCAARDRAISLATALQLLFLTATGAPASTTTPAAEPAKPKLIVENRVYETGEVARDKVVEHTFKLHNAGNAPLEIRKIVAAANLEIVPGQHGWRPAPRET